MTAALTDLDLNNNYENNCLDLGAFSQALNKLQNRSASLRQSYKSAKPYPHVVIDNLFAPELLDRLVADFPKQENRNWLVWDTKHELKTTSKGINGLSLFTQMFCLWLNSQDVISTIESIVDIDNLVGDPLFHGAGLHEMYRDGWLEMHADYTKHFSLPLMRRINILIYLNRDWDTSWGGELKLQNPENKQDSISYPPNFNRTIIFPTTAKTLHGVPNHLACPLNCSRKLLSIYYWTPVPMPLWSKMGTPLLWASDSKKNLKNWFVNKIVSNS
ncbi:2OG-Fe(II) oxygenase [Waterburya agarophytonicola K14]|uniref:2OG-Fe(II) oxygenase n=1 Tax=Waterburya agarophytonicola KI4 TaxID=2874699 RepID=A0A964BRM1_9CYAN|nr:2OG-Fe(II) oxygenase [Waterburya agarophytonicola]MCC0178185.1 2OG-Fe(II) oxygenase [Waterburya agarophytonicola KI4]